MFNIGEKDSEGRQKRIEHRGRNLRISRTGGVAVREQIRVAGVNLTANSKHGVRVSSRIAKGTNAGFQNGSFRLRGRYGKGPTKLNLSKSGISASTKNAIGTFNWLKPNRSSVKIMGVQVRGKNAATIQMVYMVFALAAYAVQVAVVVAVFLAQMVWVALQALFAFLCWLLPIFWAGCVWMGQQSSATVRGRKRAQLMLRADKLAADPKHGLKEWSVSELESALTCSLSAWGKGEQAGQPYDRIADSIEAKGDVERARIFFLAIAKLHHEKAEESQLVSLYLDIDEQCVTGGERTHLQGVLLEDYAVINGLKFRDQ